MINMKQLGFAATVAGVIAAATVAFPASATHETSTGGHAQTVQASLTSPTFVNDLFICAPECEPHRVNQDIKEVRAYLDYVLATSSHLPNVTTAAGSRAFTCPPNSTTPGAKVPGIVMSITEATLFRKSEGTLLIELVREGPTAASSDDTVQKLHEQTITPNATGEPVPQPLPPIQIGNCLGQLN